MLFVPFYLFSSILQQAVADQYMHPLLVLLLLPQCTGSAIVSSALTIMEGGKGGSSTGSSNTTNWIPLLPEAQATLLAVMVHQQHEQPQLGILAAGQLLLDAASACRLHQQAVTAGQQQSKRKHHGSKGQRQRSSSTSQAAVSGSTAQLLSRPV